MRASGGNKTKRCQLSAIANVKIHEGGNFWGGGMTEAPLGIVFLWPQPVLEQSVLPQPMIKLERLGGVNDQLPEILVTGIQ